MRVIHVIRIAVAIITLIAAAGLDGCETVGQDFKDLGKSLKPTTPSEAARMAIDQYNADNRRQGTVLVSNAPFGGTPAYVTMYREMVANEKDPIVKATAIRALARHGDPSDALRIVPYLADENLQVRWEAAKGLQRLHNPSVVPDIVKSLLSENEAAEVRIADAIALGQYPEDRVFHGLVSALDERELAVNAAAEKSLNTITGQSLGSDAIEWLAWYNSIGPTGDAFADRTEYLYPTYQRDDTFWEKMAFWSSNNFEKPAPPAGLRPKSERSTYDDEAPTAKAGG